LSATTAKLFRMADNRSYVYRRLVRELGLTPAQAAGAIGGLGGESGRTLSPSARNPTSGALGIGQWLGGRAQGVRSGDLRGQTNHLIAELKGPERGALNRLRGAHNISDATRAWVEGFERPSAAEIASSMPARLGYARDAFNAFHGLKGGGSGGGGGGGSVGSDGSTTTTTGQPDFGAQQSALPLIEALTQSQQQAPPSASIQAPDFSAHPVMPAGFGTVSGGGGPAPKADIGALAAAVKTLGGSVPAAGQVTQSQQQGVSGAAGSGSPSGGRLQTNGYPLGRTGKIIGTPFTGTHTLGDWQSDRAVDIATPVGTPMVALEGGTVVKVRHHPQDGGRFAGDQITIRGSNNSYFYAHGVASVKPGQKVHRGDVIGKSGSANGVAHLHFGVERGDPRNIIRGR
jgi:murein DD-endopeptidase MepM/ murein hydrolase activator NlpD